MKHCKFGFIISLPCCRIKEICTFRKYFIRDLLHASWHFSIEDRYLMSNLQGFMKNNLPHMRGHTSIHTLWTVNSMTSLLTHAVTHSSRPSFRPKTNNKPIKKFLSLAVSWVKVVKKCKILTLTVNFLCQKLSKSF